jgi:hypothetical protein
MEKIKEKNRSISVMVILRESQQGKNKGHFKKAYSFKYIRKSRPT